MEGNKLQATREQTAYAQLLDIGMKIGLGLIVITFAIYALGIMEPVIPVEDLANGYVNSEGESQGYWELSAEDYVHETGGYDGWGWVDALDKGDYLNFVGIAFLAGISIICYARITPILIGQKDYIYTVLVLVEIAVLVLAASGLLKSGGH